MASNMAESGQRYKARRHLVRWKGTNKLEQAMMGMILIQMRDGVTLPWDEAAKNIDSDTSGEALKQILMKKRIELTGQGVQFPQGCSSKVGKRAMSTPRATEGKTPEKNGSKHRPMIKIPNLHPKNRVKAQQRTFGIKRNPGKLRGWDDEPEDHTYQGHSAPKEADLLLQPRELRKRAAEVRYNYDEETAKKLKFESESDEEILRSEMEDPDDEDFDITKLEHYHERGPVSGDSHGSIKPKRKQRISVKEDPISGVADRSLTQTQTTVAPAIPTGTSVANTTPSSSISADLTPNNLLSEDTDPTDMVVHENSRNTPLVEDAIIDATPNTSSTFLPQGGSSHIQPMLNEGFSVPVGGLPSFVDMNEAHSSQITTEFPIYTDLNDYAMPATQSGIGCFMLRGLDDMSSAMAVGAYGPGNDDIFTHADAIPSFTNFSSLPFQQHNGSYSSQSTSASTEAIGAHTDTAPTCNQNFPLQNTWAGEDVKPIGNGIDSWRMSLDFDIPRSQSPVLLTNTAGLSGLGSLYDMTASSNHIGNANNVQGAGFLGSSSIDLAAHLGRSAYSW